MKEEDEISEARDRAADNCHDVSKRGWSRYPGMTYEEGVRNALEWVLGDSDDDPTE